MKRTLHRWAALLALCLTFSGLTACQQGEPAGGAESGPSGEDSMGNESRETVKENPATDPGTESLPAPSSDTETIPDTAAEEDTQAPVPVLSVDEVADLLRATPYTAAIGEHETCGLSDPSAVGIRQTAMDSVLYPAPADGDCVHIIRAEAYGLSPQAEDNSAAFAALCRELQDLSGQVKVIFPVGTYRFSSTLTLTDLSDVCFCSDGAGEPFTILMTEWTPGIRLASCRNIRFVDYAFTYETPSAVVGEVVRGDAAARTVTLRIRDQFDLSDPHYNGGRIQWGSYMEMYLDPETGRYCPDSSGNLLYNSTGDGIRNIEDGVYDPQTRELTLTFLNPLTLPAAGTVVNVAYTMYENFGLYATDCRDVYLESVWLYHTTGMAIGMNGCRNIYLNRVFLTPEEGSGMLMTATADGFHCVSCTGDILVTGCVFEASHDDCMNINSRYLTVSSAGGNQLSCPSRVVPVSVGDVLDVYSKADLSYIGSFTVIEDNGTGGILTVDGDTEGISDCFACNVTTSPTLTIRDCFFGNKRNRGLLIQCRQVTVENCTFRNICHGPIQIFSVPSSFGEGIMPGQAIVRNNKFFGCDAVDVNIFSWSASGRTAPDVIRDIEITNNYFSASVSYPVQISTGGHITVSHNLFDRVCPRPSGQRCAIRITCSRDVTVLENLLISPGKHYTVYNEREVSRDTRSEGIVGEGNILLEE